ncbi:Na+/H+ antiporter NhaC family protein [Crassaminicella profunda]|uniref:Na+/H+ antiporter NhaC family protein n=1 Tax=Crassaminicella profunda TaxID=1286698 RepID=UPI001CA6C3B6|nr:Na+/H+ antiporter NhaC family protein [Crassaminicella profunda]QZY56518.1 sodium:proton antiporter [Crassaminicella profunda]
MENNKGFKHIYMIFAVSMGAIATCIIRNIPLFYGFFIGVFFSVIVFMRNGFSFIALMKMILKGVKECFSVYIIVLLMGSIIAVWIASGTVPTMIYYGFDYIVHMNYLLACFMIMVMISFAMGTAFGTISTIGIALLGIGKGLSIPEPILLGTIISGAFIADKISPISALVNLTMNTTDIKYKDFFKHMLVTLIPTLIISSTIYYILGRNFTGEVDLLTLREYQRNIFNTFTISLALLLFPIIMILLAVIGVKVIPNMTFSLLGGIVIGIFFQKIEIHEMIHAILFGYRSRTGIEALDGILRGGGIVPMIEVIFIIIGAVALNSVFEGTNTIAPMIDKMASKIKTKGALIARTCILSIALTTVTCDQTVGILLPGKFLKRKYKEFKMKKITLARSIADAGTTIAPLIPWNVNAIIITVITGVGATEYGPYAVLCYISPLVTILFGYLFTNRESKEKLVNE